MVQVQDDGGCTRARPVGTVRSQVLDVGFEGKRCDIFKGKYLGSVPSSRHTAPKTLRLSVCTLMRRQLTGLPRAVGWRLLPQRPRQDTHAEGLEGKLSPKATAVLCVLWALPAKTQK